MVYSEHAGIGAEWQMVQAWRMSQPRCFVLVSLLLCHRGAKEEMKR